MTIKCLKLTQNVKSRHNKARSFIFVKSNLTVKNTLKSLKVIKNFYRMTKNDLNN